MWSRWSLGRLGPAGLVCLLALTTPLLVVPTTAAAQPASAVDEASTRYKKGIELYGEGDYRAALIEFKRAYELAPNYAVLYNMGQVYFQLQDYVGALSALEQYLAEGGKNVAAPRRAEVQKDIEKLRSRIARVELVVNVSDAEVSVDDALVGKTPLAKPLLVSAGRRKITVSKSGVAPVTKMIEVAGADSVRVSIELSEPSGTTPSPTPAPLPGEGPTTGEPTTNQGAPAPANGAKVDTESSSASTVGWVITAGLAAGAATCGILALGASGDLQTLRDEAGSTREELDDAQGKTESLALVTDLLGAAALVAGGVSLYLTLSGPSDETPKDETAPSAATLRVRPLGAGLSFDGTF
jgi:hypothetical protein